MDDLSDFYSPTVRVLLTGVSHEIFAQSISVFAEQDHLEGSNEMTIILGDSEPVYLIHETYDLSRANKEARTSKEQHDKRPESNLMDIDGQDGLAETHVDRQINTALITYDLSIKDSFNTALVIATDLKKTICPGCITLIGITSNPDEQRNVSFEEISTMCTSVNIQFEEISSLDKKVIENAFRKLVLSNCHINVVKWFKTAGKDVEHEDFLGFGRYSIYEMFVDAPDWESLVQRIITDIKQLTNRHYLRLSNEPVIDFVHTLFRKKHASITGNKLFSVSDKEITEDRYRLKDVYPRVTNYIPMYERDTRCNDQPIIFTTTTTYDKEAVKKLSFKYPDVNDTDYFEVKSSDSDESSPYYLERQARYKLLQCGGSWHTWATLQPELDAQKDDGSEHTQEEEDNPTGDVLNFPTSNRRKRNLREMSANDTPDLSPDNNSVTSMRSNDSANSQGTFMACQLAQVTTIPVDVQNIYSHTGDRLIVDIIILCPNLEICRYLSATFGVIFVDEILLHLCNYLGAKKTPPQYMNFQNSQIEGFIKNEWDKRLQPAVNYKKSFRFIQTRYAEYLNEGYSNIALTTYGGLIQNVTANNYAAILEKNHRIKHLKDFSCVMELPSLSKAPRSYTATSSFKAILRSKTPSITKADQFVSAISALSRIVDRALMYDTSIPITLRFKKKFYKIKLSLISTIPLYVLRFLSVARARAEELETLIKRLNDCKPLF